MGIRRCRVTELPVSAPAVHGGWEERVCPDKRRELCAVLRTGDPGEPCVTSVHHGLSAVQEHHTGQQSAGEPGRADTGKRIYPPPPLLSVPSCVHTHTDLPVGNAL